MSPHIRCKTCWSSRGFTTCQTVLSRCVCHIQTFKILSPLFTLSHQFTSNLALLYQLSHWKSISTGGTHSSVWNHIFKLFQHNQTEMYMASHSDQIMFSPFACILCRWDKYLSSLSWKGSVQLERLFLTAHTSETVLLVHSEASSLVSALVCTVATYLFWVFLFMYCTNGSWWLCTGTANVWCFHTFEAIIHHPIVLPVFIFWFLTLWDACLGGSPQTFCQMVLEGYMLLLFFVCCCIFCRRSNCGKKWPLQQVKWRW